MGDLVIASPLEPSPDLLIIASGNPAKVAEIRSMLDATTLQVRQQPDGTDIEETGATYLENARLKAQAVAQLTGHWALADDSGIAVDALGGAPGLYSARYGTNDVERIERLLRELGDTPYRSASFNSAVAVSSPGRSLTGVPPNHYWPAAWSIFILAVLFRIPTYSTNQI